MLDVMGRMDADNAQNIELGAAETDNIQTDGNYLTHQVTALDASIQKCRTELDAICDEDPSTMFKHYLRLMQLIQTRYQRSWKLEDVEERIRLCRTALSLSSQSKPSCTAFGCFSLAYAGSEKVIRCCIMLGDVLGDRFIHTGDLEDVKECVQIFRHVCKTEAPQALRIQALLGLGVALRTQAYHVEESADRDLQEAQELHREALRLSPEGSTSHHTALSQISETLLRTFERADDGPYLEEATVLQRQALKLRAAGHPDRHTSLYLLSASLFWQSHSGNSGQASLSEVEALSREALHSCPPDHRDRPILLEHLATVLTHVFHTADDVEVLHCANRYISEALASSGNSHPDRCRMLTTMSRVLFWRSDRKGYEHEMDEAIHLSREAIALCRVGHPYRKECLSVASQALNARGEVYNNLDDLEEAIALQREALSLSDVSSMHYKRAINNLAFFILRYSRRSGKEGAIREAVDLLRRALELFPPGQSMWHSRLQSNLGAALQVQFSFTHEDRSLREAVQLHEKATVTGNPTDVQYRCFVDRQAGALQLLFERSHDPSVLDQALTVRRRAVEIWPNDDVERIIVLVTLAITLCDRAELAKDVSDADDAALLLQDALKLAPVGHKHRADIFFGLAKLHLLAQTPYFDPARSLDYLGGAIMDDHHNVQQRLTKALNALESFEAWSIREDLDALLRERLLDTYRLTISLLPRASYFGLDARTRLDALSKAKELAVSAASHALQLLRPDVAIEILEAGRAVFWSQYMRLRLSFGYFPDNLAQKLKITSRQLDEGSTRGNQEDQAAARRRLSEQWDLLVDEARLLPGFECFMLPETFIMLSQAAERGPVVVLMASQTSCEAIVIESPAVGAKQVPLPKMTLKRLIFLKQALEASNRSARGLRNRAFKRREPMSKSGAAYGVYAELWSKVMKPVIDSLAWKKAKGRDRSRLFICSTGIFTRLPVHASGIYRKDLTDCCADYMVVSYTPTVGILLKLRPSFEEPPRARTKMLLAAVPHPYKWNPLVHAVDEVTGIRNVVPHQFLLDVPPGSEGDVAALGGATAGDILGRIPQATILHVACHGYQDSSDPLKSGFVMQDRMLTISELMALNHPKAFFAFLSACETAKGDDNQPDQVVHLAAAMLFVGFRSVVGTMWSMGDMDGPAVAVRVYKELFAGEAENLNPDRIPYALDAAIQELRLKGLHPSRWGTYVHLGL